MEYQSLFWYIIKTTEIVPYPEGKERVHMTYEIIL